MEKNNNTYKLLIKGKLIQKTAFSIGGNMPDNPSVDMPLAKDGSGRYTIRGSSLAGAFIATARQLYKKLPSNISEGSPKSQPKRTPESNRMEESVWLFHHSHLEADQQSEIEIRDNVSIRQKTGAAKDGAKFDVETLPAGTQWHFLMEVDEYRDKDNRASCIALNVLEKWQQCCWLGRDVARGLGWMQLEEVKYYKLSTSDVKFWPDSAKEPLKTLKDLKDNEVELEDLDEVSIKNEATGTILITVGEEDTGGYGIDLLSVGGFQSSATDERTTNQELLGKKFLKEHAEHILKPIGQNSEKYLAFDSNKTKNIDFNIATTKTNKGKSVPYIPGSSIRGSMRHTLSWLLRRNGENIWEPGGEDKYPEKNDIVLELFGSTRQSARLLISDALPVNDNWNMVVLEMHAEDEFTQGVFGSSKFDRSCLTKGKFKAGFYLSAKDGDELKEFKEQLTRLQALGKNNMLPVGGGQYKGMGWVKWELSFNGEKNPMEEK